jgi:AcrR family transcriptional regulator
MGRRSLAEQRRAEILDAVQVCLVKYGLAGTTLARIAQEAGMATSIIRHYLGDKDAVIQAAVDRALDAVLAGFARALESVPPEDRLAATLDAMFAPRLAAPEINQVVDELIAHSYFHEFTRGRLAGIYREMQRRIDDGLRHAYPDAAEEQIGTVAHGLLALGHSGATFTWLRFDPANARRLRAAADVLVASLGPRSGVRE